MKTRIIPMAVALAAAAAFATLSHAQTSVVSNVMRTPDSNQTAVKPWTWDRRIQAMKTPVDWLTWGTDFRVRNEYYNNIISLSPASALSEQDVVRYRGRLWAGVTPVTNLTFNGRVSAEPRLWVKPSFTSAFGAESGMEWRYGIVDNLNVKWSNVLDLPLTITAGRQDILLGDYYDWWLVSDGTPGDGSWSFFLDSIRMTYDAKDIKTKFDLIYIYQNAEPDGTLPTIGSASFRNPDTDLRTDYQLMEQNEQGVIAYVSNGSIPNTRVDGYFIYKRDEQQTFEKLGAHSIPGDNANIYTFGGKVTGAPWDHWQYSTEGAYQFGNKQDRISGVFADRDIDAYGGKLKLTYLFKDRWNDQLSLVGEYLSGDNPNTKGKDEMFDVLWGRWPRWSELYIYSYIPETSGKVAQMNNVGRVGPSWTCNPTKELALGLMYNALFAPEETPSRTVAPTLFSDNGNFRGHYLQAVAKYQFTKNFSGHLWGEWIWEGDYYAQRDLMSFLRAEVMFTF
jgi:Alginate export